MKNQASDDSTVNQAASELGHHCQGNRMNAIIVNPQNNLFTINELHKGCSQRPYLCSFLSFWVSHGDGKQTAVGGRICRDS